MKKILIFLSLAILAIAALPIIGNSIVKQELNAKVKTLQDHGVEVSKKSSHTSYLSSRRHYEFLLKDADKFMELLNNYSDEQIPPYVNAMLDGVVVGVDLEYSNLPFSKALSLDVYPLTLSSSMTNELKSLDLDFYNYLDKFLQNRGVLYHVNYDIVSKDFDGYLKDIKENYALKDSTKTSLELKNAIYHGNGDLIAPKQLISSIQTITLKLLKDDIEIDFNLQDIKTSSNFESQSTYLSSATLKKFNLLIQGLEDNVSLKTSDINMNISSNTQGLEAEMFSKTSFKNLKVEAKDLNFDLKDFNYDVSLRGMDKDSLEELRLLVSKAKSNHSDELQEKMKRSLYNVLSHGIVLDVADFSFKDIILDANESLDSCSMHANFELKEDKNFAQKVDYMPIALAQSINTNIKLKISKKIYKKLLELSPMLVMSKLYAKDEGSSLVFEISFINGEFRVNGKALIN